MESVSFSHDAQMAEQEMHAVIFYLASFGYIDGDFDESERSFVRDYIGKLVEARALEAKLDAAQAADVVPRLTQHFHETLASIEGEIRALFTESVGEGEEHVHFVLAKLKLRCFELFKRFDETNRERLLSTVDALMHADGVVHPSELAFRNQLHELLRAPIEFDDAELEAVPAGSVVIAQAKVLAPRVADHPFLKGSEWAYATDKETFSEQSEGDLKLMRAVMAKLAEQAAAGSGLLETATGISGFAGRDAFLDGHVYIYPPKHEPGYEILVLGDLHGCYSCLKAALMQADFFGKVEAYHADPDNKPNMLLVFLGDYIDRGRFSYAGILRTAMQLFVAVPEHVFLLRGNHEYYIELNGRTLAPVRPAEAYTSMAQVAPNDVFKAYREFFEALPNMLFFDRTLFVHAGIPRESTIAEKWTGLASLNDPDIRFQMLWSDPSDADVIPDALQRENARFPFGKKQFRAFMNKLGATTMIRGHERIVSGFKEVYPEPEARLLSLFSAGGHKNADLPESSNYREVTPMALTLTHKAGVTELAPFAIDYARYNDPEVNSFFREALRE